MDKQKTFPATFDKRRVNMDHGYLHYMPNYYDNEMNVKRCRNFLGKILCVIISIVLEYKIMNTQFFLIMTCQDTCIQLVQDLFSYETLAQCS